MSKEDSKKKPTIKQKNNSESRAKQKDKLKTNSKSSKTKINYKQKYDEAYKTIANLQSEILIQKIENNNNIKAFKDKAKTFKDKAQKEVNRIKEENHQKLEAEKIELAKYASQNLINDIIDPIINIQLAIQSGKNDENVKSYVIGFEMLMKQLEEHLFSYGVKKIVPKIGDDFNAKIHHAISFEKGKPNKVIEVKKPGFKLYDRVLKPAIVIIGK